MIFFIYISSCSRMHLFNLITFFTRHSFSLDTFAAITHSLRLKYKFWWVGEVNIAMQWDTMSRANPSERSSLSLPVPVSVSVSASRDKCRCRCVLQVDGVSLHINKIPGGFIEKIASFASRGIAVSCHGKHSSASSFCWFVSSREDVIESHVQ